LVQKTPIEYYLFGGKYIAYSLIDVKLVVPNTIAMYQAFVQHWCAIVQVFIKSVKGV